MKVGSSWRPPGVCEGKKRNYNYLFIKLLINYKLFYGEEGLEYEVFVDGIHLEHLSEFKYLGCILDESGTDVEEYSKNAASGRIVGLIN